MRCYSCGDDSPWTWVHHNHIDDDCADDCHTVCANCDYGLCYYC